MKVLLGFCTLLLLTSCGTYNVADTLVKQNNNTTDMARCGAGLGIDNKVGLVIKSEAQKYGGELSAQQSSEIRAKAVTEGLMTGDEKKYDIYVRCILELDKRRYDNKSAEQLEHRQQPAIKAYLTSPKYNSNDRFAHRLVIENTGEELTELSVFPAPFLFITELCMVRSKSDCKDEDLKNLKKAYIPVWNYYSAMEERGAYKGELYSIEENKPSKLKDMVDAFAKDLESTRTSSMTSYMVTLVKLRYKDKFQNEHIRYIDVTIEQRELPPEIGESIFDLRNQWKNSNIGLDDQKASMTTLSDAWTKLAANTTDLPVPFSTYRKRYW